MARNREGFADAGLNPRLRQGWPYYAFALLWPLVGVGVIVGVGIALGLSQPDFSAPRAVGELAPGAEVPPPPTVLLAHPVVEARETGRFEVADHREVQVGGADSRPTCSLTASLTAPLTGVCVLWAILFPSTACMLGL